MPPPVDNPNKADKPTDLISAIVMGLFMAVVLGVAGALLGGMLVVLFTLDLAGASDAVLLMLQYIFVGGLLYGVGAAIAGGLVTLLFSKKLAGNVALICGVVVFFGYSLWGIFLSAWTMSPWGSYIGGGLGALGGIPLGLALAKDDKIPPGVRRAALRATGSKGIHPADVEYWRAGDGDSDVSDLGDLDL